MGTSDQNVYIIMEVGWEYDDQYYYRPESRGGDPKKVFSSLEIAQSFCDEMTCDYFIKSLDYPYNNLISFSETFNPYYGYKTNVDLNLKLSKITDKVELVDYSFMCKEPEKLSRDVVLKIIKAFDINIYEVVSAKFEV